MHMYSVNATSRQAELIKTMDFNEAELSYPKATALSPDGSILAVSLINKEILLYATESLWALGVVPAAVGRLVGHTGN
eukprot:scaffold652125_cov50-Prasinocladus_malaysianus.AAC.1